MTDQLTPEEKQQYHASSAVEPNPPSRTELVAAGAELLGEMSRIIRELDAALDTWRNHAAEFNGPDPHEQAIREIQTGERQC